MVLSEVEKKESQKIHMNLRKAVDVFSYWVTNLETYVRTSHERRQMRQTTEFQTRRSKTKPLKKKIKSFNDDPLKSDVTKRFFDEWKKKKGIGRKTQLTLKHFKDISDDSIEEIKETVKTKVSENGKPFTDDITDSIYLYKEALLIDIPLEERKKILDDIETFNYNELRNNDKTNFVAAEMGFLIEFQNSHSEYFHYPITYPKKNTFSVYDVRDEKDDYCFIKDKYLTYGNHHFDLVENTTGPNGRKQAHAFNDYPSESALFFLLLDYEFKVKMIKKLIKDLEEKNLKSSKLTKLVLEIHSTNDICDECYNKAQYLFNWSEEMSSNFVNDFTKVFKEVFEWEMPKREKLEGKEVLNSPSLEDLRVEIRYSHDKIYGTVQEASPYFIRIEINGDNDLLLNSVLENYSIIVSGGASTVHNKYSCAYNKAVEYDKIHSKNLFRFLPKSVDLFNE